MDGWNVRWLVVVAVVGAVVVVVGSDVHDTDLVTVCNNVSRFFTAT